MRQADTSGAKPKTHPKRRIAALDLIVTLLNQCGLFPMTLTIQAPPSGKRFVPDASGAIKDQGRHLTVK